MKHYLLTLCIILHFFNIRVANAESIRWVTESWENYTNEDGSGLYVDIIRAAFADHQLEIINMPWKRALLEVKNGTADMTGATSFIDGYITSRFPILSPPISILFDKKRMNYTDLPSLKNYIAVWGRPYEDELISEYNKTFIKGFSVQERETAYKLLVSGRADYFLDSKGLHQVWLKHLEVQSGGELQASDFQLEDIGKSDLFMIFSDNARGQRLKVIFDSGMAKMIQEGQLHKTYEKYHLLEQIPSHLLNKN